ncbi:pseudomurein-binding repeat-containing protein [Methanobrevibacter curvatus]|uniref:Pseudomurein-binding repeat protein n=1 Tax=Methanobrevibacter curvatus TaxID=49547 RepID=A0A165ZKJ0_9EURY|nr:pseudomurein-binding repeat-containing protein [Methanobrevibacter curvatus]KZX10836.1 pseudomurein-binding repeat protein [Methanobrevibacter curvatus]
MTHLSIDDYRKMVGNIINYKNLNGQMPENTVVNNIKISKKEYSNMIERVNKFYLQMGRNPCSVQIGASEENLKTISI